MSLFGDMISCHSKACIRVDLNPICFTTPIVSPIITKSPIEKGLSIKREIEANISCSTFCKAKAIAIHHTHKLASRGVISTHKLIKTNNIAVIQTTIFTISFTILLVISADFSSSLSISLVMRTLRKVISVLLNQNTSNTRNIARITISNWSGNTK